MLEIIFLFMYGGALSQYAVSRGRARWWAAIGIVAWILFGTIALLIVGDPGGQSGMAMVARLSGSGVGALLGLVVVRSLKVADSHKLAVGGGGQDCPACGSAQTEIQGLSIVCNSCGVTTDP